MAAASSPKRTETESLRQSLLRGSSPESNPSSHGTWPIPGTPSRGAEGLHDFTAEFVSRGYYAEYCSWRDQYLRWRKGDAKGAKGENVHEAHLQRKAGSFEYWYPTVSSFTFRRTCSYWVAVCFVEGSLLFIWVPIFQLFGSAAPRLDFALTKLPYVCGSLLFILGCYFGFFELINLNVDTSKGEVNFFWCDWRGLAALLRQPGHGQAGGHHGQQQVEQEEAGNDRRHWIHAISSIVGWLTYLIGAAFYTVGVVADACEPSPFYANLLVTWPEFFGGALFALGGVCEVLHNEVYARLPVTLVWWVSFLNFTGGICFLFCSLPSVISGDEVKVCSAVGSVMYYITGMLSLCMWRGEQFGLALISDLNDVHREAGTQIAVQRCPHTGAAKIQPVASPDTVTEAQLSEVVNPALSRHALVVLSLYVVCGAVQILNACAASARVQAFDLDSHLWHDVNNFLAATITVFAVHMFIILTSACVRMPKEEPYHTLTIMMRVMVVIILCKSLLSFDLLFVDDLD